MSIHVEDRIAIDIARTGAPVHKPAYGLWSTLPSLGVARDLAAFDARLTVALATHAILIDVEHDPRDFIVRQVGHELRSFLRGDENGLRMSTDPQKAAGSRVWRQLDDVVRSGKPIIHETPYMGNFWDFYGIRMLVCPLTRTGETVDMLFCTLAFLPK